MPLFSTIESVEDNPTSSGVNPVYQATLLDAPIAVVFFL
jgi:hypothetical protein